MQTEDDQEQQQSGSKPDYEGWISVKQHLIRRRELRRLAFPLPDQVPGVKDPSQGNNAPGWGAGNLPATNDVGKVKRWQELSDKSRTQKKYTRNQEHKYEYKEEDQTPLDGAGD